MEVHAVPSSAIHITRREEEEHSVAPLPPQQWGKELCSLQTRFDRFNINIEGGAQSDSSCCSAITCEGCCQTSFDSDSASGVPVDGAAGDQTSEGCREEGFGNSQDVEGGEGALPRSHSSPTLAKACPSEYSSSVCVKDRSIQVEELHSENGRFRFVLQPDRTLVLYMGDADLWAIYLAPRAREANTTVRLILQKDGNLVALDSSYRLVWESKTANKAPGPYTLTMEDSGNCVLYGEGGVYLWATRTAGWG